MTFTRIKLLILLSLLWTKNSNAQSQLEEKLHTIHERVEELGNEDTSRVVKTLGNDYFIKHNQVYDNGTELSGVFKHSQIQFIRYSVGPSYGNFLTIYYFIDGRLIFVSEKEQDFAKDTVKFLDQNYFKLVTVFEGSYYFDRDKIIYKEVKGQKTFPDDSKEDKENLLLNNSRELLTILEKQN